MRHSIVVVGLFASGAVQGAPRTLVVGTGDCQSVELVSALNDFGVALRDELKADLYESDVVLDIVRPRPTRTLEDVERQVESARTLFYNAQTDRALDLLKQALTELERAPTVGQPWKVHAQALSLQGVILLTAGRKAEGFEAFKKLLRVEPNHALNKDEFLPSVVAQFEALRKEHAKLRRFGVIIQSNPPGAEALVEGRVVGSTPLKIDLLPGSYRVLLRAQGRASFLQVVNVTAKDAQVQVDLVSEGALSTKTPLCLAATGKAAETAGLKLANTVTADDLVFVRIEGQKEGPGQLVASRYEIRSGTMVREGRVLAPIKGRPAFADLAAFLITGRSSAALLSPEPAPAPVKPAAVAKPAAPVEKPAAPPVEKPAAPPVETPAVASTPAVSSPTPIEESPRLSSWRVASFVLLGAGAATLAAGGVVFGLGAGDRGVAGARQPDGRLPDPSEPAHRQPLDAIARADANQSLALTLMGTGVGAVTAGLITFFFFPGSTQVPVALVPHAGGATATVNVRF